MPARKINVIVHNIRSAHNAGSILRTAEGLGVNRVYLTGYTPYPVGKNDLRLPHIAKKVDSKISKTALGAEKSNIWEHEKDINLVINTLKNNGWTICGLEQKNRSTPINKYSAPEKITLVFGNEIIGIEPEVQKLCDEIIEIPMFGKKESFNVVEAGTMAMFYCRFFG